MNVPQERQKDESQEDFVKRVSKLPILHPDTILRVVCPRVTQATLRYIKKCARPVFPKAFPPEDSKGIPFIAPEDISTKDFAKWVEDKNIFEALISLGEKVSPIAELFINLALGKTDTSSKNPAKPKAKKGRYAKQKRAVRKIARKLWKQDKNRTIESLINDNEIKKNKKPDGTIFSKGTLREWTRDLAPSNKPGRRKEN
jgi:hypothetical protein